MALAFSNYPALISFKSASRRLYCGKIPQQKQTPLESVISSLWWPAAV